MKKKGLIIATIVMVLVLAVSLTTATYAWFTVQSETAVEEIAFGVTNGADVLIGLKTDNTYAAGAVPADFQYGQTSVISGFTGENAAVATAGTAYWENGTPTLGNYIDMGLDLSEMEKAVGTGLVETSAAALDFASLRKATSNSVTGPVAAAGSGATVDVSSVERAVAQQHYLDVVIGVQPGAADLTEIICNVTVNPTAGIDLGINAAIHVAWAINGMADGTNKADLYGTNDYSTLLSTLGKSLVDGATTMGDFGGDDTITVNDGAVNLPITVATTASGYLDRGTIYQLHLVIWIDGTDTDCNSNALGVASTIYVNFEATAPDRVDD